VTLAAVIPAREAWLHKNPKARQALRDEVRAVAPADAAMPAGAAGPARIGIGMTLYNNARFLPAALDSLLAQTRRDFLLVLVDDGSTDGTAAICRDHAARDPRVRFFQNPERLAMVGNWRRAFQLTSECLPGMECFTWASDHDVWDPRWLATMAAALDGRPQAVMAYPSGDWIRDGDGAQEPPPRFIGVEGLTDPCERFEATCRSLVGAGFMVYGLFRPEALRRSGIFRRVLLPDRLLMAELSLQGELLHVPEVLWHRRRTSRSEIPRQRMTLFRPGLWRLAAALPWHWAHTAALLWHHVVLRRSGPGLTHRRMAKLAAAYYRSQAAVYRAKAQKAAGPKVRAEDGGVKAFLRRLVAKVLRPATVEIHKDVVRAQAALSAKLERVEARLEGQERSLERLGRLEALEKITLQDLPGIHRQLLEIVKHLRPGSFDVEGPFPSPPGVSFLGLAQEVIASGRTLLGLSRLATLWQAARAVQDLDLPCVEIGVYRGGSSRFLAASLRAFSGRDPVVYSIDTFEGHPAGSVTAVDTVHKAGRFSDADFEDVKTYLSGFPRLEVIRGAVEDAAPRLGEGPFALVHIDVDLYAPTRFCLDHFSRRLARGGIIVVDDFRVPKCPGVVQAVREFLAQERGFAAFDLQSEQLLLVRSG